MDKEQEVGEKQEAGGDEAGGETEKQTSLFGP